jgi:hypothetical protein
LRLWKSADRIFLFTEDSKKESLLNMVGSPVFVAAQRGGKSLLMNKPLIDAATGSAWSARR